MTPIAVVVSPAFRCAVVAEEHHSSVVAFWGMRQQIECGIVVKQEVVRSPALRANDIGTLNGISAEEDGEVETNNIVVTLAGVELDGKATRVPGEIGELSS